MSRRADPARVMWPAATWDRLIARAWEDATAGAWIVWWAVQAADDGIERGRTNCQRGWEWIAVERERLAKP